MAKRKARELIQEDQNKPQTLSSGVMVEVQSFPAGLWEQVNVKAFSLFPEPVPPKKIIKVVDGTEEIDDVSNLEYLEAKKEVETRRHNFLGEAVIDLCVQVVDMAEWEPQIKRLEKYSEPFSEDPDERRIEFLTRYALRTKGDYEIIMVEAITKMMVSNPEVAERIAFFQSEVARATVNDAASPGAA